MHGYMITYRRIKETMVDGPFIKPSSSLKVRIFSYISCLDFFQNHPASKMVIGKAYSGNFYIAITRIENPYGHPNILAEYMVSQLRNTEIELCFEKQ